MGSPFIRTLIALKIVFLKFLVLFLDDLRKPPFLSNNIIVTCPTSRGALSVSTWPEVECQSLWFSFSSERFANLFSRVNLQNPYSIRGVVATRGMPRVVVVYRVSYNTVYIQVIRKGYGPTL